jgi:hypothetical protein
MRLWLRTVSTSQQSLDIQVKALKDAGVKFNRHLYRQGIRQLCRGQGEGADPARMKGWRKVMLSGQET